MLAFRSSPFGVVLVLSRTPAYLAAMSDARHDHGMCRPLADGVRLHRDLGSPSLFRVRFPGDPDGKVLLPVRT